MLQALIEGTQEFFDTLRDHGVDIAFNGHAHIYQRNLKPHAGGLVSYVTGGGGASPASMGGAGCSDTDAYGIGWKPSAYRQGGCG